MKITSEWIYKQLLEAIEYRQRELRINVIHVSEVSQCLRKSYFNRTKSIIISDIQILLNSIGDAIHKMFQQYMTSKGWSAEFEISMSLKDFQLVGHVDLYNPLENVIIEIKTINGIPNEPYTSHVLQANTYGFMARVKNIFIAYIDRARGRIKVFKINRDKQMFKEVMRRAKLLHKSLKSKQPPSPEPSPLCNLCPWRSICKVINYGKKQ